ncbi:mucin-2-like [Homarus americanus]|uniref:mucin-2-like n=1 Tax=Homarus americanus TaxID=6706 RepID=UPI001C44B621|nr:mucin-2-like [Homarus americanus]
MLTEHQQDSKGGIGGRGGHHGKPTTTPTDEAGPHTSRSSHQQVTLAVPHTSRSSHHWVLTPAGPPAGPHTSRSTPAGPSPAGPHTQQVLTPAGPHTCLSRRIQVRVSAASTLTPAATSNIHTRAPPPSLHQPPPATSNIHTRAPPPPLTPTATSNIRTRAPPPPLTPAATSNITPGATSTLTRRHLQHSHQAPPPPSHQPPPPTIHTRDRHHARDTHRGTVHSRSGTLRKHPADASQTISPVSDEDLFGDWKDRNYVEDDDHQQLDDDEAKDTFGDAEAAPTITIRTTIHFGKHFQASHM